MYYTDLRARPAGSSACLATDKYSGKSVPVQIFWKISALIYLPYNVTELLIITAAPSTRLFNILGNQCPNLVTI